MKTYETADDFISFLWDRNSLEEDLLKIERTAYCLRDRVALPATHAEIEEAYQELCLDLI